MQVLQEIPQLAESAMRLLPSENGGPPVVEVSHRSPAWAERQLRRVTARQLASAGLKADIKYVQAEW